jgi:hypothetical protein
MSIKMKTVEYGSSTNILAMPDHYVSIARKLEKDSTLATTVEGRKIVKAGTLYPANDATAIGVIFNDYDVTDGDQMAAVLIHGFVLTAKLPVAPADTVNIPQITFVEPV